MKGRLDRSYQASAQIGQGPSCSDHFEYHTLPDGITSLPASSINFNNTAQDDTRHVLCTKIQLRLIKISIAR